MTDSIQSSLTDEQITAVQGVVGADAEQHEGSRAREGENGDHTCQKRSDLVPHVKSEPRG